MTHTVAAGSGIGSGRDCRIVSWSDRRTDVFRNDYPLWADAHLRGWVAVEFADGTLDTFPKQRVIRKLTDPRQREFREASNHILKSLGF